MHFLSKTKTILPLTVLFVIVAITIFTWNQTVRFIDQQREEKFNEAVNEIVIRTEGRLKDYIDILYTARGLFAASQKVERNEWQIFIEVADIQKRFAGIQAIEFIPRVKAEDKESFVEEVRLDTSINPSGYPDFNIYPAGDREEYFVVNYIEPFEGNEKSFGFDLASEPSRNMALEEARDTDMPIITAPIVLVQKTEEQSGFLIFLPVYKNSASLNTIKERRDALEGFVLGVFRAGDMTRSILNDIKVAENLHIDIHDTTIEDPVRLTLFTDEHYEAASQSIFFSSKEINITNRIWTLQFQDLPGFGVDPASRVLPTSILIVGILFGLLIFFILYSFANTRARALKLAKDLTEDLRKFQSAVAGSSEHIMFTDSDGVLLYVNGAAERMTGYSIKEMIGNRPSLWGNNMGKDFYQNMWNTIKVEKRSFIGEVNNKRKNGKDYVAELRISPILDGKRNIRFFVGIERDVTEQKRIESMKSDFVSMASHQLKTPAAQIKGFVDNMLSGITGSLTKKQKDYLNDMFMVADRNSKLIDDLLNVSRLERGMVEVNTKKENIKKIIDVALSPIRDIAKEQDIILKEEYPQEDVYVLADFNKSVEVIRNVVHNAVQFTKPSSSVIIEVYEENSAVVVAVKDKGEGIPKDQQDVLFLKDKVFGGKVRASGSGLGLYLAKQFIELQGGSIEFKTEIGKGTTFFIRFKKNR